MKKFKYFIMACLISCSLSLLGQQYKPSWESLDKRPVPTWFIDAKFGIFIHWGLYSVPAFSPVQSDENNAPYAEWYWKRLRRGEASYVKFHQQNYDSSFTYQDFVKSFTAELFEPEQWANIFKKAGAKYVVLTSKHHDGYTLWPSDQSWNWNSSDLMPHQDLCGKLGKAVKNAGLKMGYYYSLYEWYNPLYINNLDAYVSRHMIPQMKDIVNRYQPDLLWTDGEWEHTDEEWKSRQFLAWLFNEPEVKDNIAVNDRWGKETRSLHGGFYTTEYGHKPDREKQDETDKIHPFEECRGIGGSFGYNRMENVEDYMTSDEIIHLLIDLVSKGGNLLLNVGPTADGRIPVIMQQRLLGVGRWLQENGEAIYETRTSKKFQETSIHPQIGKKLFITMKEEEVYIICTEWMDKPIALKGFTTKNNASVSLLGQSQAVSVEKGGNTLIIVPPKLDKPIQEKAAWVYKISGINIQKTMKNL